jgi:DeoR/GlpR family transcriptional regulator of sugar metabolism
MEFDSILSAITERNLIPGLAYDGFEAFLVEEHARWKSEVQHANKERIGRKAASLIPNGARVFFDAGSTTDEIVRVLCKKIETRTINRIVIATTSVKIADMISNCCVKMGFDDDFSAVRLYVPGGQIRPNTQAIVSAIDGGFREIINIGNAVGGFDLCFIGVNGVDSDAGFTTHQNSEAENKIDILSISKSKIIVGDSSKVGLVLDKKFADFSDEIRFVVDDDPTNEKLANLVARFAGKIVPA